MARIKNSLVSIIVPIYNSGKYLKRCLDSLKNQTHANLEILLVDDGSTDDSYSICCEYATRDDRFRVFQQSNKGVSAARNLALDVSSGDYYAFCDSDDWVEENFIERLLMLLDDNNADVSIVSFVNDDGRHSPKLVRDDKVFTFDSIEAIKEMHKANLFEGHLCNKCFKRELLDSVRLNTDICILEDLLVLWSIFTKANRIVFQNIQLYHYFANPRSALSQKYREKDWDRRTACLVIKQKAEELHPDYTFYVDKTLIAQDLRIAEKLILSNSMTKDYKELLIEEIGTLYNEQTKSLMTPNKCEMVELFLGNYKKFARITKRNNCISKLKMVIKRLF